MTLPYNRMLVWPRRSLSVEWHPTRICEQPLARIGEPLVPLHSRLIAVRDRVRVTRQRRAKVVDLGDDLIIRRKSNVFPLAFEVTISVHVRVHGTSDARLVTLVHGVRCGF